jgi:MFS transporter, Spinster family, sphingosine-1-phosphate transporter
MTDNNEPIRQSDSLNNSKVSLQAILLLGFMWFAYFLNYCDRQAVFAMFPSLKSDLGMTDQQLGLTGAYFLWVYALGCPVAGIIGDRVSKRILVVLSLIIWSLVTAATGLSRSGGELLWLRAAMGISESLFMPTAIALTASAFAPELRSRTIAILTTAQIAGTVVGSWFGGWMADLGAWRTAFFALGGVGLVYAFPYFAFLRTLKGEEAAELRESGEQKVSAWNSLFAIVTVSTYQILCVVFPVFVFGLWLLYGWLPTFLHDKFGLSQSDAAFNATLFLQGSTAVGLLSGGWLADKLLRVTKASRFYLMLASLVLCAPCLHAIGACETLVQVRWAAMAFGLFSGLLMGNIFASAFEVIPSQFRATAVGVLNLCGGLVSGFATLFGGLWKSTFGIDRLLSLTGAAYFGAGLLLLVGILVLFPRDAIKQSVDKPLFRS